MGGCQRFFKKFLASSTWGVSNNVPVATCVGELRPCLNLSAKELLLVPREGAVGEEPEVAVLPGSLGVVSIPEEPAEIPEDISPVAGGKFAGKFAALGRAIPFLGIELVRLVC